MMPRQKPGNSRQDYGTPIEFLLAVEGRWGELTWDLAATASPDGTLLGSPNAVCVRLHRAKSGRHLVGGLYSPEDDSFKQPWGPKKVGLRPWLNPPFGDIAPWARRCREKITDFGEKNPDYRIFFLVPASVGSNWFAEHVDTAVRDEVARVVFLQGRLSFDGKHPYPKDCMLIVWGDPPGYEVWDWNKDRSARARQRAKKDKP
jgi:hypothetical protein